MKVDELRRWCAPRGGAPVGVVLGAMNFGKRTPAAEAARILARAYERGVRLVDTANAYVHGESEKIVGAFARGRSDVLVATKVGFDRVDGKPEGLSRAAIHRAIAASRERLGVEAIDLYYLHVPDPKTPIEETMDAMAGLVRRGLVRALGVSNYASWQVLELRRLAEERSIQPPCVSQVIYNLLVRQIEIEHARFAAKYGVHVTVYNPLGGGLLAGTRRPGEPVRPGSRLDKNALYQGRYGSDAMTERAADYARLAASAGLTPVELAYGWLAASPLVDSVLVGPASIEHLDAALDALAKPLAADVVDEARRLHERHAGTDVSYARW